MRCFFVIFHDGTRGAKYTLRGVLVIHVDDTLAAGDLTMEPVWAELRTVLRFGSWPRVMDTEGVYFCGRFTTQASDFSCTADENEYCSKIPLVRVPRPEEMEEDLTQADELELMGAIGRLGWAALHGRLKEAFAVSWLQQSLKGGKRKLLAEANKIIRRAREPQTLRFVSLGCAWHEVIVVVLPCYMASFGVDR